MIDTNSKSDENAANEQLSIDEIIALIISNNTNQDYKNVLDTLQGQQLTGYTSDGLDPLTVLNPVAHSLPYLYFITARSLDANKRNGVQLFELLSHFINVFDIEQVRASPTRFALVGKALLHLSSVLDKPLLALQTFKVAIQRFSDHPRALTSLHASFINACISAKAYRFPLDILDQDIEIIDTAKYAIDIQDFLEYHYYGAIIYIGMKNYDRALDFLSLVISAPTQKAISAIQIAAYKKFVLVSLITDGQVRSIPKYTAQGVEKVCKTHALVYLNLAKAFTDDDIQLFNETASKSSSIFEKDNHLGLVKQCYQSLRRKKIKELTKVYITVGLNEMATKIGDVLPDELELILIEMIMSNQISASISITEQHVKMVHFNDEQEHLQQINLEDYIFNIAAINDRVATMNKLEGLNRDFQTKYLTLSSNGGQLNVAYEEEFDLAVDEDNKIFT